MSDLLDLTHWLRDALAGSYLLERNDQYCVLWRIGEGERGEDALDPVFLRPMLLAPA